MGKRKLKEAEIDEIVRRWVGGDAKTQLAKAFSVHFDTITKVINENPEKVKTCTEQKNKVAAKANETFFIKLAKARELALTKVIARLENKDDADKIHYRDLVVSVGIFTDKLGTNGHEEQPTTVIVKWFDPDEDKTD